MEQQEYLKILKQGTETWNKWRRDHPDIRPKFTPADIEEVNLSQVDLKGMNLSHANLEGIDLSEINLESADLSEANLRGAILNRANLKEANLNKACLKEATLQDAILEEAILIEADLQGADLRRANLAKANLQEVKLEKADCRWTNLRGSDLRRAHLESAYLYQAHLKEAQLQYATLDNNTKLEGIFLGDKKCSFAYLVDVDWGNTDLTLVDWMQLMRKGIDHPKVYSMRELNEYRLEIRACRQIAAILQSQGMNDEADQLAYRAQLIQRKILKYQAFWHQKNLPPYEQYQIGWGYRIEKFRAYIFSLFLGWLAGYGYRPSRSFLWYLIVNIAFTMIYFFFSNSNGFHYTCIQPVHGNQQICTYYFIWKEGLDELGESFAASLTAFHGRGFFPEQFGRGDPRTYFAALEAVFGLFIEASFIATFTARFYRK